MSRTSESCDEALATTLPHRVETALPVAFRFLTEPKNRRAKSCSRQLGFFSNSSCVERYLSPTPNLTKCSSQEVSTSQLKTAHPEPRPPTEKHKPCRQAKLLHTKPSEPFASLNGYNNDQDRSISKAPACGAEIKTSCTACICKFTKLAVLGRRIGPTGQVRVRPHEKASDAFSFSMTVKV